MVCPYCRAGVEEGEGSMVCQGCSTPHHQECYDENGGCTLFGCKFAPPDEPKVQVTNTEAAVFGTPAGPFAQLSTVPQRPATGFGDVSRGWQPPTPVAPVPVRTSTVPPPPRVFQAPASWPSPTVPSANTGVAPAVPAADSNGGSSRSGYVTPGGIFDGSTAQQSRPKDRSRLVYILLGIFLGVVGAHNFYAGFYKRAVLQLCLTVLTFGYGAVVTWIWALAEVCTVDRDGDRREFY